MELDKSPKFSFKGWNVWLFIKGRRNTVVSFLAMALAYFFGSSKEVSLIAGIITSGVYGALEFYFKEVNLKK